MTSSFLSYCLSMYNLLSNWISTKVARIMHLFVVLTLVGLSLGDLSDQWFLFKKTHDKIYSPAEEVHRRLIWEGNVNLIQKHNLEADMGRHTYWLGMNKYGDLTEEEYKKYLTGLIHNDTQMSGLEFLAPNNIKLPGTVDWREKGYVTDVKDQGHCGSCWAFSATGSLEGQHFKKTGKLVSLSEQNLVDCSKTQGNYGCNGGFAISAFKYIGTNNGIDTEMSYPYEGKDMTCRFNPSTVGATISGYVTVAPGDEKALQQAVATVGPISVDIDARSTFQFYKHGVYNDPDCSSTFLNHAVLAVGYGTESGSDYWLVKNSWGVSWGEMGYIKMSRNKDNQCGIATSPSYPLV